MGVRGAAAERRQPKDREDAAGGAVEGLVGLLARALQLESAAGSFATTAGVWRSMPSYSATLRRPMSVSESPMTRRSSPLNTSGVFRSAGIAGDEPPNVMLRGIIRMTVRRSSRW